MPVGVNIVGTTTRETIMDSGTISLDAQSAAVLARLDGPGVPQCHEMSPQQARDWMATRIAEWDLDPVPLVDDIDTETAPGPDGNDIAIRIYRPDNPSGGPLPMMVFFHAGGFVFGSLDTHDSFCRLFCRESGALVLSVDYRRSPEAKFPAPLEDGYSATVWAAENAERLGGDPARLAVGGDSSGGTLAIAVCQFARERGGPQIAHQMLWYPGTGSDGEVTESAKLFATGFFLSADLAKWSMGHYLNDPPSEMTDPLVQPLRMTDFSGLPPCYLATAGHDGRRDDNRKYVERLKEAGVATEFVCLDSTIHGYLFMLGGIDIGVRNVIESAAYFRKTLGSG